MLDVKFISTTHLTRELRTLTGQETPTKRKLYELIVDGYLPAEQVNGRWYVTRADLPAIAVKLGLAPAPAQSPEARAPHAAASVAA